MSKETSYCYRCEQEVHFTEICRNEQGCSNYNEHHDLLETCQLCQQKVHKGYSCKTTEQRKKCIHREY